VPTIVVGSWVVMDRRGAADHVLSASAASSFVPPLRFPVRSKVALVTVDMAFNCATCTTVAFAAAVRSVHLTRRLGHAAAVR
jgi:hypothetical protein